MHDKLSKYYEDNHKTWEDDDTFKKALFTVAGGTLSIYAALGAATTTSFASIGFFLIALSMVFSIASKLFTPQGIIHSDAELGLMGLNFDEKELKEIKENVDNEKNKIEISLAESSLKSYVSQLQSDKKKYAPVANRFEKILRWLHVDVQILSDWQKYSFMLGVIVIALGLITPTVQSMFHTNKAPNSEILRRNDGYSTKVNKYQQKPTNSYIFR